MEEFREDFGFSTEHYEQREEGPLVEGNEEIEANDEENKEDALADVFAAAKAEKRRKAGARKPLLDAGKLCGKNGLVELQNMFNGVKFKGRGHEIEDLNMMMKKLEYWAHCLCPNLPFDEALERIEKLGSTRPIQTALTRMRTGGSIEITASDEVDELGNGGTTEAATADVFNVSADLGNPFDHNARCQPEPQKVELTEEQRRRIEENKRRALERRLASDVQPRNDDDLDDVLASLGSADFDNVKEQHKPTVDEAPAFNQKLSKPVQYFDNDFMEEEDVSEEEEAWMALAS